MKTVSFVTDFENGGVEKVNPSVLQNFRSKFKLYSPSFKIFLGIMKFWQTKMRAIDPRDGVLKTWDGMLIPGIDIEDARNYCENAGLQYLTVENKYTSEKPRGRLESEIMNELYIFKLN
jgi:hypothetical protein